MNPSQTFAYFIVGALKAVKQTETDEAAGKIVTTIDKLCKDLNLFYVQASDVNKAADELLLSGEDLVTQFQDERLEMFITNFDTLNNSIEGLIAQMNTVRVTMGEWWASQEAATNKWFFLFALNKVIVERGNWHLEALDTIIQGLNSSLAGLREIRDCFAQNPKHMVDVTLKNKVYFDGIRDGLASNEPMALGWWTSFDEELQLIKAA